VPGVVGAGGATGVRGIAGTPSGFGSGGGVVGDSHDGLGVVGTSATFIGVIGVQKGNSSIGIPTAVGGGQSLPPVGVFGDTNTAHYAVVGANSVGTGVYGCAFASADEFGGAPIAAVVGDTVSTSHPAILARNSTGAQLRLVPSGGARPASGVIGDLFEDSAGALWLCLGGASFRKLGGPTTSGQLHVLPSPVRVYDSRTTEGPLAAGAERAVSLANGLVGNTPTPAVRAGALAALFTLTIVNTGSQGFLAAFSNAVSWPGTSNINWFQTDSIVATSVTSAVDSTAEIKVHCGGTPTNFVVDVSGYYE